MSIYNLQSSDQNMSDNNKEINKEEEKFQFTPLCLNSLRNTHAQFCTERDWEQYHTPRNLLLAMVGEVGELSELFQWSVHEGTHL